MPVVQLEKIEDVVDSSTKDLERADSGGSRTPIRIEAEQGFWFKVVTP